MRFATQAAEILAKLDSEIERNVYTAEVSRMTGVEESALQNEIQKRMRQADESFAQEAQRRRIQRQRQYGEVEKEEAGVIDAQKSLLYFSASHQHIYEILQNILTPEDFPTKAYADAFTAIGTLWAEAGNVFPAELISFFEDAQTQRQITAIFAAQPLEDAEFDLQKAIKEAVTILKRNRIEREMAQAQTVEQIQACIEQKRKLEALHITI